MGIIGAYYKSTLQLLFKPELTNLSETRAFQVKLGNEKCFSFCIHLKRIILLNKLTELTKTLNDIKGRYHTINLLFNDLSEHNA